MVGTPATISSDFTCIVEEVINAAFRLNRVLFLAGNCYKCIKASHGCDICCGGNVCRGFSDTSSIILFLFIEKEIFVMLRPYLGNMKRVSKFSHSGFNIWTLLDLDLKLKLCIK